MHHVASTWGGGSSGWHWPQAVGLQRGDLHWAPLGPGPNHCGRAAHMCLRPPSTRRRHCMQCGQVCVCGGPFCQQRAGGGGGGSDTYGASLGRWTAWQNPGRADGTHCGTCCAQRSRVGGDSHFFVCDPLMAAPEVAGVTLAAGRQLAGARIRSGCPDLVTTTCGGALPLWASFTA